MKKRLLGMMMVVLMATAVFAVEIETPAGYTPWFSVDGQWMGAGVPEATLTFPQPVENLPDWRVITVVAVASNQTNVSPVSEPSVETLIAPVGTVPPIPGWSGLVVVKNIGGEPPVKIKFEQPAGPAVVTRFTFFIKERDPFGPCTRPKNIRLVK